MIEKFNHKFKKYFSKGPTAAILVLCLIVAIGSTVAFSLRKTVTVIIDGKENKLVTYKSTVGGLLKSNKVSVKEKDLITPSIESKITKGDTINIKTALPVKVKIDGQEIEVLTVSNDVEAMLTAEGFKVREEDRVLPGKDSPIVKDMGVEVVRVDMKDIENVQAVDFNTVVKNDENMMETASKTIQEGKSGEKKIKTRIIYENGQEVSRKVVSEAVTKEPVSKIVAKGTMKTLALSRGTNAGLSKGNNVGYRKTLEVRATAYHAMETVGKTYTASGGVAVRNPNGYSTIAVDPRVIPLGTKLYVEGYGYAIAADTGTGIKGNSIDVFFNTYNEAENWGVKYIKVYIVD